MSKAKKSASTPHDRLGERLGATIARLRQAGKMSLGDLSEQSGVAKSLISQIEKNESNPTLSTITRLSAALGTTVEAMIGSEDGATAQNTGSALVEHSRVKDTPVLTSDDGKFTLRIIGSIATVELVQWYDCQAQPGGTLVSSPHPPGSVENLTVLSGQFEVKVGGETFVAKKGETLRYHADMPHEVKNISSEPGHATMVNILAGLIK